MYFIQQFINQIELFNLHHKCHFLVEYLSSISGRAAIDGWSLRR